MAQTFGEWLTAAMNERRWTPAQLARRSRLRQLSAVPGDGAGEMMERPSWLQRRAGLCRFQGRDEPAAIV